MAKLTWLGEDEDGTAGPSFTICFEMKFPKGDAVEVRSYAFVQKALRNRFFKVDDADDVDDAPGINDAPGKPRKVGRPSNADKAAAAEAEAAKVQAPSSDLSEPTKISEK